ncbi:AIPR family protein [Aquimarina macrocephali]|uniref:AIPR family protein n=1 Tax=Aquimarina macrocephali TaxID=666563 RepID=UPI000465F752|nr:AIPR family protein [Aquimarina macrocephali]
MSIYRIIDKKIEEVKAMYATILEDFSEDVKSGSAFMIYSLTTIFNDRDFSDIETGIIDSAYRKESHDYGIDSVYLSANRSFITSIDQLDEFNEDTKFTFHLFQFKKGRGVDQGELLKFKEGVKIIFVDENVDEEKNTYLFEYLVDLNEIKNELYERFSSEQIHIKCYICFGGSRKNIEDNDLLMNQVNAVSTILDEGGYSTNTTEIYDAQRLIDLDKKGEEIVGMVSYEKTFKYITETDSKHKLNGHISIIKGNQIAALVKQFQTSLFEANIRDYYRRSELNSKILKTSADPDESKLFWSFNNGLTITCRKVEELPGDKFRLHGIQIVNGCQTSNSLYQAAYNIERKAALDKKMKGGDSLTKREQTEYDNIKTKLLQDDVAVLIKIIETSDSDLIYRITETTNSQTPIKTFSLKANDTIQHLIEEYLKQHDIFYERRLNFWKNQGKRNTVSIQHLYQLFESQIRFMPSQVKTRPKAMFGNNYDEVFPDPEVTQHDFNLYLIPIKVDHAIAKRSRIVQRQKLESDQYKRMLISHGKFHLGCFVLHSILGGKYSKSIIVKNTTIIIRELLDNKFEVHYNAALDNLKRVVQNFAGNKKESVPSALKKVDLDGRIVRFINK